MYVDSGTHKIHNIPSQRKKYIESSVSWRNLSSPTSLLCDDSAEDTPLNKNGMSVCELERFWLDDFSRIHQCYATVGSDKKLVTIRLHIDEFNTAGNNI